MKLALADAVAVIPGVGRRTAAALGAAGIHTVADLLWHFPHRWEDRVSPAPLHEVRVAGEVVTVCGRLVDLKHRRVRSRLSIVEGAISDGETSLAVVWFHQPYLARTLQIGQRLWLHGSVRPGRLLGLQLQSPEWEVDADDEEALHHGRIVPVYRRLGFLTGRRLRALMFRVLHDLDPNEPDLLAGVAPPGEPALGLVDALAETHFPAAPPTADARKQLLRRLHARLTAAQRRLAQHELMGLALALEKARQARRAKRAEACVLTDELRRRARAVLPFRLTGAQKKALKEIVADLQRPIPMGRLLHGDVGTGKTVVAVLAALVVADSGAQVAVLAPTELLAEQHHATFSRLLATTGHRVALLVGSMVGGDKREVREGLTNGTIPIVIGTHALLEESVRFARLGLAIIDEQHRFGVVQRQQLLSKGQAPHVLIMTATPIPRSLALALYGDLDVSLLDQAPPGRVPVRTVVREATVRSRVLEFVAREVGGGAQVYWVVPFIEESHDLAVRAIANQVREVRRGLPGISVGVMHGRLPAVERERVMAAFVGGELAVLCATTVIEVGVDVPRATVMVIENAERFGLAQLHQLRGRVGRGRGASYCILLLGDGCTPEARERLRRFASLADGFAIAEEDFRQRGPGEFTGLRQWGRPGFKLADLRIHREELEFACGLARRWAEESTLDKTLRLFGGVGGRPLGPA